MGERGNCLYFIVWFRIKWYQFACGNTFNSVIEWCENGIDGYLDGGIFCINVELLVTVC